MTTDEKLKSLVNFVSRFAMERRWGHPCDECVSGSGMPWISFQYALAAIGHDNRDTSIETVRLCPEEQRDILAAACRKILNSTDAIGHEEAIAQDALREAGIDDNSAASSVVEDTCRHGCRRDVCSNCAAEEEGK